VADELEFDDELGNDVKTAVDPVPAGFKVELTGWVPGVEIVGTLTQTTLVEDCRQVPAGATATPNL
jgi:hypothetical protein